MNNDLIEYFIGEKATFGEAKGIIIKLDLEKYEVTFLNDDGRIVTYLLSGTNQLFINDHKNIRNKILSTPKPKKLNKFENIDV